MDNDQKDALYLIAKAKCDLDQLLQESLVSGSVAEVITQAIHGDLSKAIDALYKFNQEVKKITGE